MSEKLAFHNEALDLIGMVETFYNEHGGWNMGQNNRMRFEEKDDISMHTNIYAHKEVMSYDIIFHGLDDSNYMLQIITVPEEETPVVHWRKTDKKYLSTFFWIEVTEDYLNLDPQKWDIIATNAKEEFIKYQDDLAQWNYHDPEFMKLEKEIETGVQIIPEEQKVILRKQYLEEQFEWAEEIINSADGLEKQVMNRAISIYRDIAESCSFERYVISRSP